MHDHHDYDHHHHHHDHDHHHHDHDHHHHEHGHSEPLSFAEKLTKRLENWQRHNDDHIGDYRQWAEDAAANGHAEAAARLQDVVELSRQISTRLVQALQAGHLKP